MTAEEAARFIDISAVRSFNTYDDVVQLVELAKKYRFINVHVLPCWTADLSKMLKGVEGVYVGSPVGFPSGGHTTEVKLLEARRLIDDGVEEMDIVMNLNQFKSGNDAYVKNELCEIVKAVEDKVLTKVIIEINLLNDMEMFRACDLVMDTGADFLKTGTGWVPGDANLNRIEKIKNHCGDGIKIKAAGGVRTREEFSQLLEIGVERVGVNLTSALDIIETYRRS